MSKMRKSSHCFLKKKKKNVNKNEKLTVSTNFLFGTDKKNQLNTKNLFKKKRINKFKKYKMQKKKLNTNIYL